ncbi:MAG: Cys-tRNA(Pro) deacylase, partial [Gammaproteobacteria bacterium]|nr:Cys-tRNA(Pro) deacylase [Gammaproteobacteria bacterium]
DAERVTGHVVGGISPLGQAGRLPQVLDASAVRHAAIFVSAGRCGLELVPRDLLAIGAGTLAPIAR